MYMYNRGVDSGGGGMGVCIPPRFKVGGGWCVQSSPPGFSDEKKNLCWKYYLDICRYIQADKHVKVSEVPCTSTVRM